MKDDHYRLKQNYETLKHTCLELQDQGCNSIGIFGANLGHFVKQLFY